ncbi:MAG: hypothetical protein LH645_06665 [Actinomycetia bacterium]|nr:hypothetical protein [Actinomycetes bacterium]
MTPSHDAQYSLVVQHMLACGGGASHTQLASWGVESADVARMLRRGVIRRTRRGYYVLPLTGDPSDRWQRERSAHLREVSAIATSGTVTGLRSAALAWDLPVSSVPKRPEVVRPQRSGSWPGVRVVRRHLPSHHIAVINGIPVTSIEWTAVDIALDLPTPLALITVDAALRRGASQPQMLRILSDRGSVRGCREARQTLDWADGHSESPLESRGRGELMLQGVPRPWSNVSLRLGAVEFRTDHWWDGLGITGEADGRGKYDGPTAPTDPVWTEKLRQEWLEEELGILVVRYVDREIHRGPVEVEARWRRREARRTHQLWVPPSALEIFQRPFPGSSDPIRWFRHRDEGEAHFEDRIGRQMCLTFLSGMELGP